MNEADLSLPTILDAAKIPYCLIGAHALASHGWARYSADVDFLCTDLAVLRPDLWVGLNAEIRLGDADDPLRGVIRVHTEPEQDIIVSRSYAAHTALEEAKFCSQQGIPVASPLGLTLLKLEAGSPQDLQDICSLIAVQRELGIAGWVANLDVHLPHLTSYARSGWRKVASMVENEDSRR